MLAAVMLMGNALPASAREQERAADDGLLLHYDFSKTEGTSVKDSSGNGNDGVIRGNGYNIDGDVLTLPGGDNVFMDKKRVKSQ